MSKTTYQEITVRRSARYYLYGKLSLKTKKIWIAFHGYGQLAEYFIRKFHFLDPETNFVIAPEGLSRFYLEGTTGRIGASWMTREDRLNEIEDFKYYLNSVFEQELKKLNLEKFTINLFGFSQGVPTLWRWLADKKMPVDNLILWSGFFPPDVTVDQVSGYAKNIIVAYGNEDPYLKTEHKNMLEELEGENIQLHHFTGKHEIPVDELKKLTSRL